MNWYLAKVIFRIVCGEGDHTPQFDEQLRLIAADNNEHALCKARSIGRQEATCFADSRQKIVEWQFIDVTELYTLTEAMDGAEVYSQIQEANNAELYLQLTQDRAAFTRQYTAHVFLQG